MNGPTSYGVCVPCCCRCGKDPARRWGQSWLCPRHWRDRLALVRAANARKAERNVGRDVALLLGRGSLDVCQMAAAWGLSPPQARARLARLRRLGLAVAVPGTLPVRHVPSGGRG
jgi:hypothetical protein